MKSVIRTTFVLITLLCVACQQRSIYSEQCSMPISGWHADSVVSFSATITDTISTNDVLILLRHTNQYPYQNIWLFVDEYAGDSLVQQDTIEAIMADDYGKWHGKGWHRYTLPLLYESGHRYAQKGVYTYRIRQGMRTDCLVGLSDIGIQISQQ